MESMWALIHCKTQAINILMKFRSGIMNNPTLIIVHFASVKLLDYM